MPAGGVTRRSVDAYLNERELSRDRIAALRNYLASWMTQYPGEQHADLAGSIQEIESREDLEDWLERGGHV